MVHSTRITALLGAMALFSATVAVSGPIDLVNYSTVSGNTLVDFQEFPGGFPGTNVDGILSSNHVSFAERFTGQVLGEVDSFDTLSGSPEDPLVLEVGLPGRNLSVSSDPILVDDRFLSGNGPLGFPDAPALGEGALAMLFSSLQFELGMRVFGGDQGTAIVDFFRSDGSLIETLELAGLPFDARFGVRREGNVADIAGISIYNDDPGGIGFTEIRIQQAPEPGVLGLLGTSLVSLAAFRRRRSRPEEPRE